MSSILIPLCSSQNRHLVRGENCAVYDADGRRYIDFESGDWAANLGHSHPRITQVLAKQAGTLMHDGLRFRNRESEELSRMLLELLDFPGGQCAFLNSGSEAVNLAITLARRLTGRSKILKIDGTYLAAYGHGRIAEDNPDLVSIALNDYAAIASLPFREFAAFVFEPGNSWGRIRFAEADFIRELAGQMKRHDGLLIANEVTTGYGRTGRWFGYQHYDYQPDIVAVGKALGNGYPVSGVAITRETAACFAREPFRYAQSHQNDPLGCAVGCEVVRIFCDENMVKRSRSTGEAFVAQLSALREKHVTAVADVRGRGMMLALELVSADAAATISARLVDEGFLIGCKDAVLRFMPPLTIAVDDIDALIGKLDVLLGEFK